MQSNLPNEKIVQVSELKNLFNNQKYCYQGQYYETYTGYSSSYLRIPIYYLLYGYICNNFILILLNSPFFYLEACIGNWLINKFQK